MNSRKKYRLKKKVCILFTTINFLIVGVFLCYFYINSHKLVLKLDKDISVPINDKVYNLDNVKVIENGTIITKKRIVNTSKVGSVSVDIEVEDYFKKKSKYKYTVNVYDNEKPVIKYNDEINVNIGEDVDLLSGVSVSDNSNENILVNVQGDYDLEVADVYELYYVAKDSSDNECREKFILNVNDDRKSISEENTSKTSKGFDIDVRNGVTYVDGYLIANKTYSLPSDYGSGLTSATKTNFDVMKKSASNDGINIYISSGFRSYSKQKTIYNNYVKNDGRVEADTYSARPGHSEHQSGLSFDVNIVNDSFAGTKEAIWLDENCYKFGFILRYPKGKSDETGYKYEPWHFRYVGEELAGILYNNGNWISMEDYFGITSEYK